MNEIEKYFKDCMNGVVKRKSVFTMLFDDMRFLVRLVVDDREQYIKGKFGRTEYLTTPLGIHSDFDFDRLEFELTPSDDGFIFVQKQTFVVTRDNFDDFYEFLLKSEEFMTEELWSDCY